MEEGEYVSFHKALLALANNEAPNRKGRRLCRKARELDRQYRREKDHLNAIFGYSSDPSISELWECKRSTSIQYAQLTHAHLASKDRLTRKMMSIIGDHDTRQHDTRRFCQYCGHRVPVWLDSRGGSSPDRIDTLRCCECGGEIVQQPGWSIKPSVNADIDF